MNVRKISIANKLIILISIVGILCSVGIGYVTYQKEKDSLISQAKNNGAQLAGCAAQFVDGDLFKAIKPGMEESEEFAAVYDAISVFRDNSSIEYIYTMKISEDNTLVFVVDTDPEDPADIYEEYEMLEGIEEALKGNIIAEEEVTTDEWGSYFSAYAPIYDSEKHIAGIVGIDIGIDWINEQLAGTRNTILVIGSCFVVMSILAALVIGRGIGKGLKKLNEKVVELSGGDGDLTKEISMTSGDELEVIGTNINNIIRDIRKLVGNVAFISGSISGNGESLSHTAEENAESIVKINERISNLSANMEECSAGSETVISHLDETSDRLNDLAGSALNIKEYTEDIKKQASGVIADAKKSKDTAFSMLSDAMNAMDGAVENAGKITLIREISEKIEAISQQTKILSLNAQIEAARAGEMGHGFAVVAESVGELSEEISSRVKEMNNISTEVIAAVNELIKKTEEISKYIGTDIMQDYEKMVSMGQQYNDNAGRINNEITTLEKETNEININIQNIKDNLDEIGSAINDSTVHITELNVLSEQVTAKMEGLDSLSKVNANSAIELKGCIAKYKC